MGRNRKKEVIELDEKALRAGIAMGLGLRLTQFSKIVGFSRAAFQNYMKDPNFEAQVNLVKSITKAIDNTGIALNRKKIADDVAEEAHKKLIGPAVAVYQEVLENEEALAAVPVAKHVIEHRFGKPPSKLEISSSAKIQYSIDQSTLDMFEKLALRDAQRFLPSESSPEYDYDAEIVEQSH